MDLVIPNFAEARILVVGDVMLDRYWTGDAGRISPEAPVPVVHVSGVEERAGGAGNVAANLAALGAPVELIAPVGDDETAVRLGHALAAAGIEAHLLPVSDWTTVTKLRVISRHQQLIRLDFEQPLPDAAAVPLEPRVTQSLATSQVVVFSDYGKGALSEVRALIERARAAGQPVLVDPKGTDWERYHGATVLTPNRSEFEAVVGPCVDERTLEARAADLRGELGIDALLVTRSDEGMSLFTAAGAVHIGAETREVFDVTGAGDTVIATLAAGLGAGLGIEDAARMANVAAGIVVGKLGAATVSSAELALAMHSRRGGARTVMDLPTLLVRVQAARAAGERIVLTNGCFDILHPGHVAYLAEARRLGDRLIVAVNDDASVARLKGPDRPLNPVEHRMAVLDALASVDWVIPFAEDTPESLVAQVLPDVLVKGGDYTADDVAGGEVVRQNGGEVCILPFREGHSTTAIIEAMRAGRKVD